MNKQEFLTKVQSKVGFHSIIEDKLAPDHIANDPIEKRYLYINHTNADGTMGKTFLYYLHDTTNDFASFYNIETIALDIKENPEQKKLDALQAYLKASFDAYFIGRFNPTDNWAEADTYKLNAGKLEKKSVIVFKKGNNPISHLEVI